VKKVELSNINVQVKAPANNDAASKSSTAKNDENNFSKVYKEVSTKNNNDNSQSESEAVKTEDYSVDEEVNVSSKTPLLGNKLENADPKDEKDFNKLVELLLMSGTTNQNLLNLLTSNSSLDTNEIKEMLMKMLKDNLSSDFTGMKNALNLKLTTNEKSSMDEIVKMILDNKGTLDEGIDKLAAKIADKLVTDKDFRANVISNLLTKAQGPVVDNEGSLKKLILNQLQVMTDENTLVSDANNNMKTLIKESIPTQAAKDDLKSDFKTEMLNTNTNITKALDISNSKITPTVFKPETNTLDKEDLLLKQLVDSDSSKNNKDNVSDKIANVLNRIETIRFDKPIVTDGTISINKTTFNQDFIKTVKFMDINNLKELSVKVIPKDLGEIVIRLSMDNGVMKANITASNKDTYNLLNSQLPAISHELSKQNMNIQNFSLSLYNGENFLFSGDGSRNENGKQQTKSNIKVDEIEDLDLQKEQYLEDHNSVNILA
jgi:flagellar hook-length control protein FliK